jgi:hypothetical protein
MPSQHLFEVLPLLNPVFSPHYNHREFYNKPEIEFETEWEEEFWQGLKKLAAGALIAGSTLLPSQTKTGQWFKNIAKVATSRRKEEDERRERLENAPKKRKFIDGEISPNGEAEFEGALEFLQSTSPQIAIELLASRATEAETELEAAHLICSILPVATFRLPQYLLLKRHILPKLGRILTVAVSALYRDQNTRILLRTLPSILQSTVSRLNHQITRGHTVTPQTAMQIFKQHAYKMIRNPQQFGKTLQYSNTVLSNTLQSYVSNSSLQSEYEKQWLFEYPYTHQISSSFKDMSGIDGDYMAKKGRWDWRNDNNSLPRVERVGRSRGNAPRNNQDQNSQTGSLAKKYRLTKEQRERLHRRIQGEGYNYQEIEGIIKSGDYFLADAEKIDTSTWLFEVPFAQMEAEDSISKITQLGFGSWVKLDKAPTHSDVVNKKGLYVIFRDRALVYLGQSGNLATRLRYHRLSITHFNLPINNYRVRILDLPRSTEESRKKIEQQIRDSFPIALKHQRANVESEYRY